MKSWWSLLIFINCFCETPHFLAGSSFFRDDTRLRALRFLDHMLVCALKHQQSALLSQKLLWWFSSTLTDGSLMDFRKEIICKNQSFWKHYQICGKILILVSWDTRFDRCAVIYFFHLMVGIDMLLFLTCIARICIYLYLNLEQLTCLHNHLIKPMECMVASH